jgi:hypothetical protein
MNNNIVTANHYLEEEGLIYLEDIKQVGIHLRGLAKLLDCNIGTVQNLVESRQENQILEATLQTRTGEKTVNFILENTVIDVLEAAVMSTRVKPETRQNAMNLYRRFALAGLKLMVMMKVAPEKLGIVTQPTPTKPPSLMDLTHGQPYRLAAYAGAREAGLSPAAELIEGIAPIFLTAPSEAAWLAEKKKFLEGKEDIRLAEATMLETYEPDEDDEESMYDLFDGLAEDIAALEADPVFGVSFREFESRLKAMAASDGNVNALPPMSEGVPSAVARQSADIKRAKAAMRRAKAAPAN